MKPSKIEKAVVFTALKLISPVRPSLATKVGVGAYRRWGMRIDGTPNYVSSRIWFDGTDYSLIGLGHGCTLSSYIRVLTHDWSAHTILKGLGANNADPVGRVLPVSVGEGSFVGTGCILMPGSSVGNHSIVGAGSVVRGLVEPFSIVAGSPAVVVGDVREYLEKRFPSQWEVIGESKRWLP